MKVNRSTFSPSKSVVTYLLHALQPRAGEFIHLRRDTHRRPDLAFEEHRTAALVADKLEASGYAVEHGVGGTGVVGTLARGKGVKRLGIRADMDALPIIDDSRAEWCSVHRGMMHACGHDGHAAMLLAAARHLVERGSFDGMLHSSAPSRSRCKAASDRQRRLCLHATACVPGSYLLIGNGLADGNGGSMMHNPGSDFNDHNIGVGSAHWVQLTERLLDAKGHAAD